ncbi:MAG: hypothetical protein FJ280_27895, partial [Planctomycetes bacterium]|nr:hypothetical protein [Planctomycetota bacterium]
MEPRYDYRGRPLRHAGWLILFAALLGGCHRGAANLNVVPAGGGQKVAERCETTAEPEKACLPASGTGVVTVFPDRPAAADASSEPDAEPNEPDKPPQPGRVRTTHQESSEASQDGAWYAPYETGVPVPMQPLQHRQDGDSKRDESPLGAHARDMKTRGQDAHDTQGRDALATQGQDALATKTRGQDAHDTKTRGQDARDTRGGATYGPPVLANGEDVLQLDLPERLEMMQLLDLAAEYLRLDYLCDLEKIKGQWVSLRLHGKLRGEIRVKDLYPLLESVLKFKGYVMTCHAGGLVTIVPVADALQVDPVLLDAGSGNLEAGDIVVTRVFDLQYVNTASAMSLLDQMKLSVAASPLEENRSLIVTCYAHRMARIERLLSMVDRPGRPKEFRFRQLKYTMAHTLTKRVETLVAELRTLPTTIAPVEPKPAAPLLAVSAPPLAAPLPKPKPPFDAPAATDRPAVYLDADERTNRILMIGPPEQLALVEEVIDALDMAQHDPRILRTYGITHLNAADARNKLDELGVVVKAGTREGGSPPVFVSKASAPDKGGAGLGEAVAMEEIQVTVLETTNSLLVNATPEQHARVGAVLGYVDV